MLDLQNEPELQDTDNLPGVAPPPVCEFMALEDLGEKQHSLATNNTDVKLASDSELQRPISENMMLKAQNLC